MFVFLDFAIIDKFLQNKYLKKEEEKNLVKCLNVQMHWQMIWCDEHKHVFFNYRTTDVITAYVLHSLISHSLINVSFQKGISAEILLSLCFILFCQWIEEKFNFHLIRRCSRGSFEMQMLELVFFAFQNHASAFL